ncbi:FAD-dependent monooxygenase [Nonomuraea sp. SMC257]|uniref:FAD-dependent monooxygenase n=1 Tax=Nonomuraea montanisoli TaxID=2741721 RepID=A0A7Y6I2J3_9ACTN|nr:FAD-dependent oxidoreductase [Nonomuraea montanisoli]NUW30532.1 FAD-dependent monooxygenase [Nonomuraea montanisoli]
MTELARTRDADGRIVVAGGGVAALSSALLLAQTGREVVLIDPAPPSASGEDPSTSCVAQIMHPHGILSQGLAMLSEHLPAVLGRLLKVGGTMVNLLEGDGPPVDTVLMERWMLDAALRAETAQARAVRILADSRLTDVTAAGQMACAHVRGRLGGSTTLTARCVIDATGTHRRTWSAEFTTIREHHGSPRDFHSVRYKLMPGARVPPLSRVVTGRVTLPDDTEASIIRGPRDTFHAVVACSRHWPMRRHLRDPAFHASFFRAVPGLGAWTLPESSTPMSSVLSFASMGNHWIAVSEHVTAVVRAGDALFTTNPAHGRGISHALTQSLMLARALGHSEDIHTGIATYRHEVHKHLRPWFDDSVLLDDTTPKGVAHRARLAHVRKLAAGDPLLNRMTVERHHLLRDSTLPPPTTS